MNGTPVSATVLLKAAVRPLAHEATDLAGAPSSGMQRQTVP